jgi:AAA domain
MNATELLEANGIALRSTSPGRYDVICPECSHKRKPAHRGLKCLNVVIEGRDRAFWRCNHCDWSGPQKGAGAKPNGAGRPELTAFEYRDAGGVTRFRKVRNLPGRLPRFWLEQPDGRGGWARGTKGANTAILYRIDEIAQAIAAGRIVCVVEGEKDVDRLWRIGVPATCNAHGASDLGKKPKWCASHSAQLAGADIIVFNDNDAPGYAHADATCKLSLGIARRVRRLDLKDHWPDIPSGGDVSDWLALGHSGDELATLIAAAPDYASGDVKPPPNGAPPIGAVKSPKHIKVTVGENMEPQSIAWLWPGWLAHGKLHILAGRPGCLKTTTAIDFGATVTVGGQWPDRSPASAGNVLIWSGEDAIDDTLLPRFMAAGGDRARVAFISGVEEDGKPRGFDPAHDLDALVDVCRRIGEVNLIIIDPVVAVAKGDSHKNAELASFCRATPAARSSRRYCSPTPTQTSNGFITRREPRRSFAFRAGA